MINQKVILRAGPIICMVLIVAAVAYSRVDRLPKAGDPPQQIDSLPGAAKFGLEVRADKTLLRLKLMSEGMCQLADLDYVKQGLTELAAPSLILTVEPLIADKNNPPAGFAVRPDDFILGKTISLALPIFSRPTPLGLFVCSDAAGTSSCLGKESQFTLAKGVTDDFVRSNKDKVFYFFPLLFEKHSVNLLGMNWTKLEAGELAAYGRSLNKAPETISRMITDASVLARDLRSMPVEIDGPQLTVNLPRMDPKACVPAP